jgi:hypothetical protein
LVLDKRISISYCVYKNASGDAKHGKKNLAKQQADQQHGKKHVNQHKAGADAAFAKEFVKDPTEQDDQIKHYIPIVLKGEKHPVQQNSFRTFKKEFIGKHFPFFPIPIRKFSAPENCAQKAVALERSPSDGRGWQAHRGVAESARARVCANK